MIRRAAALASLAAILFAPVENLSAQDAPPTIELGDKGVVIRAGAAGNFTLPFPGLRIEEKDYKGEPPSVNRDGEDVAVASYPSGAELRVEVSPEERTATYSFSGLPPESRAFVFPMRIPIGFREGGSIAIGNRGDVPFPYEKEGQFVDQGSGPSFMLRGPVGGGFRMVMPGDVQQVQDNRAFGWPIFMYSYQYHFRSHAGKQSFVISFEEADGAAAGSPKPADPKQDFLVDRYGQSVRKDFPNKVKSDDELKSDIEKEKAALAPLAGPSLDSYGGLAGSGEKYGLKKTGFFHIGEAGGRQVLVTPEGNAFFHLGVCGIALTDTYTLVAGREKTYEWLPPEDGEFATAWRPQPRGVVSFYAANWIRKFGRPFSMEEWSGQAVKRLRSWGLNSGGAFSVITKTMREMNFPYVATLPHKKGDGLPVLPEKLGAGDVLDPFAPGVEAALGKAFDGIAARADDPLLIGYFLGNEQHFELIPKKVPTFRASQSPAKARLVEMLGAKYGGAIEKFNAAWDPAKPFKDFDELKEEPLFVRTQAAAADMAEFFRQYLDAYYALVTRAFRKCDPNHLLIGSRHTAHTANTEEVIRAGGKYLDVISVNYYTYPIEGDFLRKVHEWSGGRPIILSEWYYSTTEAGLGASRELANQEERGKAYRNYVEQAAALPFVVGVEWFTYSDQAITGRWFGGFHGEGNNTGLVDVADRPYADLVAATRTTGEQIYDVVFGAKPPFAFDDPRFAARGAGGAKKTTAAPRALPGMKLDGTTAHWPGVPAEPIGSGRMVIGRPNPGLRGDFRLCWDDENLYFLIQVKDPTPGLNEREAKALWSGDGVELFLGAQEIHKGGALIFSDRQILLGAGKVPKIHVPGDPAAAEACQVVVAPDVSGDGYALEAVLPWKALGITPSAGMEMLFDIAINNSDDGAARRNQLVWNGTEKNSGDRGAWGRLRLVEN